MGMGEILVVLVVVLLVFGANKIPQLGDALGKGIRNFKKAQTEDDTIDVTPSKQSQLPNGGASAPTSGAASESKKV
jgi:sec-independent protein translocase protein TatA